VEAYFDKLWGVFVGLGWWMLNRLTSKLDDKADSSDLAEQRSELREMDKKIDALNHTSIGRVEYKSDISLLHNRLNHKEDKIKTIRIEKDKGK
jgi:hypothetical protein